MVRHAVSALVTVLGIDAASLRTGLASGSLATEWDSQFQAAGKPNAIQRVLTLLEEMQAQIQKEGKADQDAYEKMTCWCTTTKDEKSQAVEDAEERIDQLMSAVEGGAASDASLGVKVDQLKKEIGEKTVALKQAVAIREKDAAEFRAEEKDSVSCITNVKNAITVLGKHNSGLLQMTPALMNSVMATVRSTSARHEQMLLERDDSTFFDTTPVSVRRGASMLQLTNSALSGVDGEVGQALRGGRAPSTEVPPEFAAKILQQAAVTGTSFAQEPDMFSKTPGHQQAYAPQSGQIFGILKQMREDFEENLGQTQKDELKAAEVFKQLQAAAVKEIAASKSMLDEIELENSAAVKGLSDAKEDLEATREQRTVDVEFLRNVELECQGLDREYAARTKARNQEISAVAETMAILTSDESRELFTKKYGSASASFLQLSASSARAKAAKVLMDAARRFRAEPSFDDIINAWDSRSGPKPHQQLAAIAMTVRLDGFDSIKKACDNMIADLQKQQAEEVKTKATCDSNMHTNDKEVFGANETLKDIQANIEDLEDEIAQLSDAITEATADISATEISVKAQGLVRQQENKVFQDEVNDQRAIQLILGKAIERMAEVYRASFIQTSQSPSSPVKFAPTKKNAGGSPVIAMMESVVEDSKSLETEAMSAESDAQQAYATFINDASNSIKALNDAIDKKSGLLATAKANKEAAESQEQSVTNRLEDLQDYRYDLHEECDYVMKNFDKRQGARLLEIEAIQKALAYLSGMK